jgi:hypothetical protein
MLSLPSTIAHSPRRSRINSTRYFHSWKFEPSFSSDGISYRRLEACAVLLEDVELDDMEGMLVDEGVAAGGAADTEGVFDIYIYMIWLLVCGTGFEGSKQQGS